MYTTHISFEKEYHTEQKALTNYAGEIPNILRR